MKKDAATSTKELFFNNVAHEFRTPLSLILGPAEQLLAQEDDPVHQQKLMRHCFLLFVSVEIRVKLFKFSKTFF